jgi:hypothetical protein
LPDRVDEVLDHFTLAGLDVSIEVELGHPLIRHRELPEELHRHSAFFLLAVVGEAQHDDALGRTKLRFVAATVA